MPVHYYLTLLHVHVGSVLLSGGLFTFRGSLRLRQHAFANHVALRRLSYAIDTVLLGAAIGLTTIIHQYPLRNAWLTAKLLLLIVYIVLGSIALKRGRTPAVRAAAFVAALATYGYIIGIAVAHHPLGIVVLLKGP